MQNSLEVAAVGNCCWRQSGKLRHRSLEAVRMNVPEGLSQVQIIASGAYGTVLTACQEVFEKQTKQTRNVAVKVMEGLRHDYGRKAAFSEVYLLRRLQFSTYVVKMYSAFLFVDQETGRADSLHMTMEKKDMDVASLIERVRARHSCAGHSRIEWAEEDWCRHGCTIVQQVLCALSHVHSIGVVHRDVKPQNILVDVHRDGTPFGVKLADLGLARVIDTDYDHTDHLTNTVSTRWYRAPEVLFGKPCYTDAIDVWSAGCVFAEFLLCGYILFPGVNNSDQLERIERVLGAVQGRQSSTDMSNTLLRGSGEEPSGLERTLPSHIGQQDLSLLKNMLTLDDLKRPRADELLEHAAFASFPPLSTRTSSGRRLYIEAEVSCHAARSEEGFVQALARESVQFRIALPTHSQASCASEATLEEQPDGTDQELDRRWPSSLQCADSTSSEWSDFGHG